ncbi:MAG: AbrB/MazE/SpoVT family DNA-binding domain-containing protein [Candidatus Korarchaeota archaeon]|nr:AbrB/MazE/SpoVT family DNA-binding domain-containing protein [Candidatus Korarchaeota archaeon]
MPAKVSTKGQLVLPARIRRKYGISPGKEVEILDFGYEIVIVTPSEGRGRGMLKFRGDPVDLVMEVRRGSS